jgi:FMN-dependent NADH-azoreductase
MKVLHLDSSITGANSASRAISAAIVERLRETEGSVDVTYHDLVAEPLPHLTLDAYLALGEGDEVQQLLDADVVVIGAGLYNFSIPSQLKAWIDRIAVRGKTFSYSESGPVGLAGGTRVIVALARGNVYHEGAPNAAYEHAETYLRSAFTFIGVTDLDFVIAEGLGRGEDARYAAIEGALAEVRRILPARDAALAASS